MHRTERIAGPASAETFAEISRLGRVGYLQATLAHEMRNHATIIRAHADLALSMAMGRSSGEEAIRSIVRSADDLVDLTEDLLGLSRDPVARGAVPRGPGDLGRAVSRSTERLRPLVGEMDLVVDARGHVFACFDEGALERIVANLLANAGKYAPEGSAIVVSVCGGPEPPSVIIDDAGPGIPPEERELVFQAYWRSPRTSDAVRGTGLGLSIVAELAEQMGATVSVHDSPLGGARFVLELPTRTTEGLEQGCAAVGAGRTDGHDDGG